MKGMSSLHLQGQSSSQVDCSTDALIGHTRTHLETGHTPIAGTLTLLSQVLALNILAYNICNTLAMPSRPVILACLVWECVRFLGECKYRPAHVPNVYC